MDVPKKMRGCEFTCKEGRKEGRHIEGQTDLLLCLPKRLEDLHSRVVGRLLLSVLVPPTASLEPLSKAMDRIVNVSPKQDLINLAVPSRIVARAEKERGRSCDVRDVRWRSHFR